jgi:GWxTD domain-containing protein
MKTTRRFAAALFVMAIAASAFAALSDANTQFGNGPARFLMSKEEMAAWKSVNNDTDAQAFIDKFWARRDPTPGTPANEFKAEFEARAKYADDHFAEGRTKGSLTDRGRIFLILGSPSVVKHSSGGSAPGVPSTGIGVPQPGADAQPQTMTWTYDQAKTKAQLPAPTIQIGFVDQYGNESWRLDRSPGVDVPALLAKTVAADVTNPNATGAPAAQAAAPQVAPATAPAPVAAAAPSIGAYKTPAFQTAIQQARSATDAPYKNMTFSYGEFVTPTGTYFVPVQLALPATVTPADAPLTFFGEVTDANGTPVAIYEEPAKLLTSKNDVVFDKTLMLTPGTYKGTFGLADATGKVISIISSPMTLKGVDKATPSISDLILSNNIYPLTAAQLPTDPYAFGGMKVVPKSDRTFTNKDELWYFLELRNPGIDAGTNMPKIQMKLELTGKTSAGKDVKMANPLADAETIELKGVPGHFGIGQALPLESFKPGTYTMKVKVIDVVTKQTYNLEETFKVVG